MRPLIFALGYLADVAVVGAYWAVQRGRRLAWLNWTNALGAFPVAATEVYGRAWPALVVTCAFGVVGWAGVLRP